jgi:aminopeptidase N
MRSVLNRLVYQKGGWVLHMLRGQMGTDTFWTGIREYYRTYRNRNASTADLQRVMEQVSGQNLAWFFRQWLYRAGSPVVKGSWEYNAGARQIEIELRQVQPGDVYRLPLEIGITSDTDVAPRRAAAVPSPNRPAQAPSPPVPQTRIERVELDARQRTFTIAADRPPLAVRLDPNTWTLMDGEFAARPPKKPAF